MAMTGADYLSQLQALLPQGPAWPRDPEAVLTLLLDAWAEEFARVDGRAGRLQEENDPRVTTELLADWERVAGLPSSCMVGIDQAIAERRAALHTKLTRLGGQSRQFFIDLAASLGYTVTITEFRPFHVNDHVNDDIAGALWTFVWQVNAQLNTVRRFTVGSAVNEALASWGNALLECAISQLKPAHTKVLFAYT